jgi:hypothetical protein
MKTRFQLSRLAAVMAVGAVSVSLTMRADTINIGGVVNISPDSTLMSCAAGSTYCQDFSFSNLAVVQPVDPSSDTAIVGAVVTLPWFGLGWNGSMVTFAPPSGTVMVSYSGNSLTGTLTWTKFLATGSGGYQADLGLSNMMQTGTDPIFADFASTGVGNGVLTLQFTGMPQTLTDLFQNQNNLSTSLSGTLSTPEPASMALMGGGLIALSLVARKRRKNS